MWRQSGHLGDDTAHPSSSRIELYFGEGGVYDADDLDCRVHMLSELLELLHHLAADAAGR